MFMSRIFKPVVFVVFSILCSCSATTLLTSHWEPETVNNLDLYSSTEANYYNTADGISLKFFNNEKYIDLILETNVPNTLRKIYNLGLSVWIDPEGKSRNILGINHPLPSQIPYTEKEFQNYLTRFSSVEFQEELLDRFQDYEIVDSRINERISTSRLNYDDEYQVDLRTSEQILFSIHIRIAMNHLFTDKLTGNEKISIGIASINEANEDYYSALSSKEVIQKRMKTLQAGTINNPNELMEWWTNIKLATKPQP